MDSYVYVNVVTMLVLTALTLAFQVWVLREIADFSVARYFKQTLIPCTKVFVLVTPILFLKYVIGHINDAICLIFCIVFVFMTACIFVYRMGLIEEERNIVRAIIKFRVLYFLFRSNEI